MFVNSNLSGIKQTGVFDLENPPNTTIFAAQAGSTNMPAIGGNSCIVFQLLTANDQYKAMFAFGFGSDKIAINRKNGSSTWTGWKYITLS